MDQDGAATTLTVQRFMPRWYPRILLAWAALVLVMVGWYVVDRIWGAPSLLISTGIVLATQVVVIALHIPMARHQVRAVTISAEGLHWQGPWSRSTRPWSDFTAVGMIRPAFGARVLAAVAAEGVPPSTAERPPVRIEPAGFGGTTVMSLVQLTPRSEKQLWDLPDDDVIAAVRAHAGDRWVDELAPPEPG